MRAGLRIVDDTGDGTDVADGPDADGDGDEQGKEWHNNHDGNDVEGAILEFWVHAL